MKTYLDFRQKVESKQISVGEELNAFLRNIEEKKDLNAFITITAETAKKEAEESDLRFANGNPRKLEGLIIAIKDNISTKGVKTTCGSKILENFVPIYNATAVQRLKDAGAIVIGKTNLDEFAMGSSNETSFFGPVKNHFNPEYTPGGSSGGSAVAVGAGMAHVSLGSDTGGSVRQPAAFTGIYGLKPTYGRISRYGLVAFASSLDQIGVFGACPEDVSAVLDVISGKDEMDSTSSDFTPTDSLENINDYSQHKFKIGVLSPELLKDCSNDIIDAYENYIERFKEKKYQVFEVNLENLDALMPTYSILSTAEASANLSRFDGVRYGFRAEVGESDDLVKKTRSEGFGAEVKRRIMLGTFVLSSGYYDAYYTKAQKARRLVYNNYKDIFASVDIFFLPTTPTTPFKLGEKVNDPIAMYLSDLLTVSANLAGNPAISVPAGFSKDGFPIGMQLQANHFAENKLMGFAKVFESL